MEYCRPNKVTKALPGTVNLHKSQWLLCWRKNKRDREDFQKKKELEFSNYIQYPL